MASPTTSPFERLPHIALDTICEYLDDESDNRCDLWSLSLTSRRCCAATEIKRFCQLVLPVPSLDKLGGILIQLKEVLDHGNRFGLVRRLKVQGSLSKAQRLQHIGMDSEDGEDDEIDEDDTDDSRALDDKDERLFFDTHPFCLLRKDAPWYNDEGDRPDVWLLLADLIRQLPSLVDLVWAGSHTFPRPVLDAVHQAKRSCRLHLSGFRFRLPSLIYDRASPQSISPDDYALATSPSLHSVSIQTSWFIGNGHLDYTGEALQRMIAGLAPNLMHVWLTSRSFLHTVDLHQAYSLGRPDWGGFFPGDAEEEEKVKRLAGGSGNLQNFILNTPANSYLFTVETVSNLRRLHISWSSESVCVLADLAMRGYLASLEMLCLVEVSGGLEQWRTAINQLLGSTKPLRHLSVSGHISDRTFDIITRHHGETLRFLSLMPHSSIYHEPDDPDTIFIWTVGAVQKMADRCQRLEDVALSIDRTRGDRREVERYRALSQLPHLKRVSLHLSVMVASDPRYRPYQITVMEGDGGENSFGTLCETFSNCAIDATLARAIFDVISSGGRGQLQYLRIDSKLDSRRFHDAIFLDVIRLLARMWVCRRTNGQGRVVVTEIEKRWAENSTHTCSKLIEEREMRFPSEADAYPDVFMALWPGSRERWWEGWTSLPLST